ncbi:MAG: iron-sulfur cluster assembly scaffold protein [Candidatus Levybacteria bacterium]|nr:iron-sulfur cluster assembly scaffold protein [Candidatus Levybacteria bacterium]
MNDNLYKEEILEHYKNPQNFGKLVKFDVSSKQLNPFCGDEIEMFVKFEVRPQGSEAKVKNVKFLGRGCAISMAAGSILTEYVKGKTKKQLTSFTEKDMLDMIGIKVSQTRKKCALLPLFVLKDCLYGKI